jgi:hypothetical protein
LRVPKLHAGAAAVSIDELDTSRLEGGLDGEEGAGVGRAGAALEVDDGALGNL